jgi:hypothetical protein
MHSNDLYASGEIPPAVQKYLREFEAKQQEIDAEVEQLRNPSEGNKGFASVGSQSRSRASFQQWIKQTWLSPYCIDKTYALRLKKPGFLPNLSAATSIFVKNPVSELKIPFINLKYRQSQASPHINNLLAIVQNKFNVILPINMLTIQLFLHNRILPLVSRFPQINTSIINLILLQPFFSLRLTIIGSAGNYDNINARLPLADGI